MTFGFHNLEVVGEPGVWHPAWREGEREEAWGAGKVGWGTYLRTPAGQGSILLGR